MDPRREIHVVSVFPCGPGGGNPAPLVLEANGMSEADMQEVARVSGCESGFLSPPSEGSGADFALRYWVPNHEMPMCGHVTVGAVWLLEHLGRLPRDAVFIETASGLVEARVIRHPGVETHVEVAQPSGKVEPLPDPATDRNEILSVLGITAAELGDRPICNAATSRVKTLVPLGSMATLHSLRPDFDRMEELCERIQSTGLYPFAVADAREQIFEARQFPKASGYPEDAATGIAATALAFGLLQGGWVEPEERPITVRQGRTMGRPSEMIIRFRREGHRIIGCWLSGTVRFEESNRFTQGPCPRL